MTWYGFRRIVVLPLIVIVWIATAFSQLQAVFLGFVPIPTVFLRMLLLSVVVIGWFAFLLKNGRISVTVPLPLLNLYLIWVCVVLVSWSLLFRLPYPASYLAFSLNAYFFFPLLALFFVVSPASAATSERHVSWLPWALVAISIPAFALGIAQFALNQPVVPVDETSEYQMVTKWTFGERTRAFSIFPSGWKFGEYIAFVGAYSFAVWHAERKRSMLALIGAFSALPMVYLTLTRNAYVQVILSLLGVYLIARTTWSPRRILLAALLAGVAILLATVGAAFLVGDPDRSDVTSNASIIARLAHWADFYQTVSASAARDVFLGLGIIQNDRFNVADSVSLDNTPIAIFAYVGVIPAALSIWLFGRVFEFVVGEARENRNPLWLATAGWCFSVPSVGSLNTQITTPALLLVMLLCASPALGRVVAASRLRRSLVIDSDNVRSDSVSADPSS